MLKTIDNPKFTQTAKSNLENKDSKTGVLNLQGCKGIQSPKLKPNTILITKDGIKEILSKSRKVDPVIIGIMNKIIES